MGTYYILANRTKKEYIDAFTLGFTGKAYNYSIALASLVGYIMVENRMSGRESWQFDPNSDESTQDLQGHWTGDDIYLMSEYDEEYEKIFGSKDGNEWVDISKEVVKQWNDNVDYMYDDIEDEKDIKMHEKLYFNIDK